MTLSIKVLGPGCPNCQRVEENTKAALERVSEDYPSLEATIQHVTERSDIGKYAILSTPGLVINEQVVCAARIPEVDEIVSWLREAM